MPAKKRSAEDDTVPLPTLFQFHAGETLEKQTIQAGNVQSRHVAGSPMPAANAADEPFLVDHETKGYGEGIIYTVPASASVDQRSYALRRQVRFAVVAYGPAKANIDLQGRA